MEKLIAKLNELIDIKSNGEGSEFDIGFIIGIKQALSLIESQPPSSKEVKTADQLTTNEVNELKEIAENYLYKSFSGTLRIKHEGVIEMINKASQFNPPSGGGSKEDAYKSTKEYMERLPKECFELPKECMNKHYVELYPNFKCLSVNTCVNCTSNIEKH